MQFAGCSRGDISAFPVVCTETCPRKKLNLLQFATGSAAKPSATAPEIVRCEFANANLRGEFLYNMPDQLFRHGFAPNVAGTTYAPKETTSIDSSRRGPVIQKAGYPIRDGNGSNVTSFPAEVHNCPVPFTLLKMADSQHCQFVPAKPAGKQKGKKRPITFTLHLPAVGRLPQSLPLLGGQPVAKPHSQFLYALDSPYPGSQVCAKEPAVGRLVREPAHRSETKVDSTGSEIAGFQMHSVSEDHRFAERQPWLGTVPIQEFVNRVPIPALSIGTGKAVEDSTLGNLEVWQPQHRFRGPSFGIVLLLLLHHPWPPPPRLDHPSCAAETFA